MPTLVRTVSGVLPISALTIAPVTAQEVALAASPNLIGWWRPDEGLGAAGGWRDMKADILPLVTTGVVPPYTASGGLNGKPYCSPNACRMLAAAGTSNLPASTSFSVVMVGRLGNGSVNGLVLGNATGDTVVGFYTSFTPRMKIGGTLLGSGPASAYADGQKCFVFSYNRINANSHEGVVRTNGVAGSVQTSTAALAWADQRLMLLSDGTYPFNGEVSEIMLYATPLGAAVGAPDLAALSAYTTSRYGVAA